MVDAQPDVCVHVIGEDVVERGAREAESSGPEVHQHCRSVVGKRPGAGSRKADRATAKPSCAEQMCPDVEGLCVKAYDGDDACLVGGCAEPPSAQSAGASIYSHDLGVYPWHTLCTEQCVGLRDVWALSAGNLMDGRRCDVQMYLDLNSNCTQMGSEPVYQDNNLGRYFIQYSTVLYRTRRGPRCKSSCSSM